MRGVEGGTMVRPQEANTFGGIKLATPVASPENTPAASPARVGEQRSSGTTQTPDRRLQPFNPAVASAALQRESLPGTVGVQETTYVGNRYRVSVTPFKLAPKSKPGSPSDSEAKHGVLAALNGTGVESLTVIPGPGYLGLTRLAKPDAIAAAAHIDLSKRDEDAEGDRHDRKIVKLLGYDVHATAKVAQGMLRENAHHVDAVAAVLKEQGTVTGEQMRQVMDDVDRKKGKVQVIVEDLASKKQQTEEVEPTSGRVVFDQKWINSGVNRENLALAA